MQAMHTGQYRLGYARPMTELEKGPRGLRRGRGARERILSASQQLFRDQGINRTGMDQLCAVAEVSKRTLYQHFPGKDELIAEHLRRFDPDILPEVFDRTDLTPRERLLAAFDIHSPLCPFIAAAVEIHDPGHPARVYARDYKQAVAARLTETAREAGATNPEQLGEQLALLLDGASARSRVLNTSTFSTAAAIAAVLIDNAIPSGSGAARRRDGPFVNLALRGQSGKQVPCDVPDDVDDHLGRELGVGVVELRRQVRHAHRLRVFDEARPDRRAQSADRLVDEVVVQRPFGHGLRLDGYPRVGITRRVACQQVLEGAGRGVALGERISESPGLAQGRDQRGVTVFVVDTPNLARPTATPGSRERGSRSGRT